MSEVMRVKIEVSAVRRNPITGHLEPHTDSDGECMCDCPRCTRVDKRTSMATYETCICVECCGSPMAEH